MESATTVPIQPRFYEFRVPPIEGLHTLKSPGTATQAFLPLASLAGYTELARTILIGRSSGGEGSNVGIGAIRNAGNGSSIGFVIKAQNLRIQDPTVTATTFYVETQLVNLGTSSIALQHSLISKRTKKVIADNLVTMVRDQCEKVLTQPAFKPKTPIPFDKSLVFVSQYKIIKSELLDLYKHDYQIQMSDLDMLGHTNHGSYFRFSEDVKWLATRKLGGFKSSLLRDLCSCPILSADSVYLAETFYGQQIEILFWPLFECDFRDVPFEPHLLANPGVPVAFGVEIRLTQTQKPHWRALLYFISNKTTPKL